MKEVLVLRIGDSEREFEACWSCPCYSQEGSWPSECVLDSGVQTQYDAIPPKCPLLTLTAQLRKSEET